MAYNKGVVVFLGDQGRGTPSYARTNIPEPVDLASISVFSTYLTMNVTECVISKENLTTTDDKGASAPGTGVDVDVKAVFVCRNTDNGAISKYKIPGPKAAIIVSTAEGRRIDPAIVSSFASALSVATGKNYVGLSGYIEEVK